MWYFCDVSRPVGILGQRNFRLRVDRGRECHDAVEDKLLRVPVRGTNEKRTVTSDKLVPDGSLQLE